MEIIRSIFIGVIQGISEFLPISSSGHLVLIPYVFKWDYNGLSFDVALHFGTVIAMLVYFWSDWVEIITNAIINLKFKIYKFTRNKNVKCKLKTEKYPSNLFWQIIVATIPAAIVGFFLNDYIDKTFHSNSGLGMLIIALNLTFFGLVLWYVDSRSKKTLEIKNVTFANSFMVGLAQTLALMPGVSRSGITITTSRALGLSRESAARFSFMLATPAMVGAFLLKIKDISANDLNPIFIVGVISSTIFSFLAIRFLLNYLKKENFSVFVWYRILLAVIIFGIYLWR